MTFFSGGPMSDQVRVVLPDGSMRDLGVGATILDLAKDIGPGLAKVALAAKRNGEWADLGDTLHHMDHVQIVTTKSPEAADLIRHSTAHLMAMAIQKMFPGTQITIGPVVGTQFYYDIVPPGDLKIGSNDFEAIEGAMRQIAEQALPVTKRVVSRDEAIRHFQSIGETFKAEIAAGLPEGEEIKIYDIGYQWGDLCRGPHVPNTSFLKAFKLMSVAGAYWRADKNNAQLTRIYGTAFPSAKELAEHLVMLEEAKKRDHVKLGRELGLFSVHPEVAIGAPFFHPHGAKIFTLLQAYVRKKTAAYGFQEIMTPQIMNVDLWKRSGHYDNYRENMYMFEIDDVPCAVKPMSCPAHVKIFTTGKRSYRELPLRFAEFGVVHRHELSGTVHGLTRVRRITQDDGHIFCTQDQILDEVRSCLRLVKEAYAELTFQELKVYLSTRPDKRVGEERLWDKAEKALEDALRAEDMEFTINPGDGAFYGPKIDINVRDAIGRFHQCATIQLDFHMPRALDAEYVTPENSSDVPVMIHRALLGSVERFMGVLIEHCAGHFPLGLAPVQARVLSVADDQVAFAEEVERELRSAGVRVESDTTTEKLGFKIRKAQLSKIPYMLVIGPKEAEHRHVTARFHDGSQTEPQSVASFVNRVRQESGAFWGLDVNQV
jgi:threonyl-tRNA synthetase